MYKVYNPLLFLGINTFYVHDPVLYRGELSSVNPLLTDYMSFLYKGARNPHLQNHLLLFMCLLVVRDSLANLLAAKLFALMSAGRRNFGKPGHNKKL